jgi:alpha-tubulin suppressor-like RCC1 family protein
MAKYFIGVSASTALIAGSYGCRQVIGWEEATYWGDGGSGGMEVSSSSSGGGMGMAGAGGIAGMGGMGGAGGAAGAGGSMSGCQTDMDCPSFPNSMPKCDNGKCGFTCNAGFGNCTVGAGCETNVTNNKAHCGACNNGCAAYCEGTTCNDPVSIAGGYHHHCAVMKNGDVYCWGRNEKGELGDGTLASKSVPTKVKGLPGPAVQVDGGASATANAYLARTCAVLVTGELWCWGDGNGIPSKVNGLSNIKQVSVGDSHTCAVDAVNLLYCWGGNKNGQVGDGSTSFVALPKQIATAIVLVSAGGQHTCAVTTSGTLQCWGLNASGQLGINSNMDRSSPTLVMNFANVTNVRTGASHTCALSNGTFYCWGANQIGQLGVGNLTEKLVPADISLPGVIEFDLGFNFSGAMTSTKVFTWGFNGNGQLGTGNTTTSYDPVEIALLDAKKLVFATASSCALTNKSRVLCWGLDTYGQLGSGGSTMKLIPTLVNWL